MWTDRPTRSEIEYNGRAFRELQQSSWAAGLLRKIQEHGGVSSAPMPLLFELRIAYAFHQYGHKPEYEFATGSGAKSVDFRVQGSANWLIEALSLNESDAVHQATRQDGWLSSVVLTSLSADPRQSEEGEVIRAMERIADKAKKFPIPSEGAIHLILVDMRGYTIGTADVDDFREIAYGATAVREECQHFWNGQPVVGLFDPRNTRDSARLVQTRVHFLGFLKETRYREGEVQAIGHYFANPGFFKSKEESVQRMATFPLRARTSGGAEEPLQGCSERMVQRP